MQEHECWCCGNIVRHLEGGYVCPKCQCGWHPYTVMTPTHDLEFAATAPHP
jgi:hypothetical protein